MSDETDATLQLYKAHTDIYVCSLLPGQSSQQQYTPEGLLFKSAIATCSTSRPPPSSSRTPTPSLPLAAPLSPAAARRPTCRRPRSWPLPKSRWTTSWGPTRRECRTWSGSARCSRGASLPSVRDHPERIGCEQGFGYLHSPDPDRNLLVGAVVGGPDGGDHQYTDSHDNYAQAEPATYTRVLRGGRTELLNITEASARYNIMHHLFPKKKASRMIYSTI
jgi:hypothetical protein